MGFIEHDVEEMFLHKQGQRLLHLLVVYDNDVVVGHAFW